jgi:hypothetical protein
MKEAKKEEISRAVIEALLDGGSLRKATKAAGVDRSTFIRWISKDQELLTEYLLARQAQAEHYFDEILDIADEPAADLVEVNKRRIQIDARKWVLSKMNPKRYGKQLTLENIQADRPRALVIRVLKEDEDLPEDE